MANLTNFTSYDEIRAVLGVSVDELEDATLALPLYVRNLVFELTDLAEDMDTVYLTIAALPAVGRSAAQQRFYDVAQLYSAYSTSKQLLTSLPLFSPKQMLDGRAEFERHADPFDDVRAGVIEGLHQARKRLLTLYQVVTGTAAPVFAVTAPIFVRSTGIATDPVTGA
jgi:hypothetical protein